jgi:hypothetical protein
MIEYERNSNFELSNHLVPPHFVRVFCTKTFVHQSFLKNWPFYFRPISVRTGNFSIDPLE